jgi:prolyl-tRNA editing enzyme YbaK/EbsC (Cys-tRNA(Pro) deacylase)
MADAQEAHLPAEQTAKTVLLHTPGGYRFALIPACDRLDLHKAAADTSCARRPRRKWRPTFPPARSARPADGPDTPAELIDVQPLAYGHVLCAAGDHKHSLLLDPADIARVSGAERARSIFATTDGT